MLTSWQESSISKMFSSDNHLEIFYSQTILITQIFGPQINIFARCSPLFSKRMGQHLGFMKKPFGKCNLFYRISALLLLKRNNIEIFEKNKMRLRTMETLWKKYLFPSQGYKRHSHRNSAVSQRIWVTSGNQTGIQMMSRFYSKTLWLRKAG